MEQVQRPFPGSSTVGHYREQKAKVNMFSLYLRHCALFNPGVARGELKSLIPWSFMREMAAGFRASVVHCESKFAASRKYGGRPRTKIPKASWRRAKSVPKPTPGFEPSTSGFRNGLPP